MHTRIMVISQTCLLPHVT